VNVIQGICKDICEIILGAQRLEVYLFSALLTVAVAVNGELWTSEDVFWENKLEDRRKYSVVYSMSLVHLADDGREALVLSEQTKT
jgi:hypothetical protein